MSTARGPGNRFQIGDELPTVAIIRAIETLEDVETTELPPLYESIDSDALDQVCRSLDDGQISFSYHGYRITVNGSREFHVEAQ